MRYVRYSVCTLRTYASHAALNSDSNRRRYPLYFVANACAVATRRVRPTAKSGSQLLSVTLRALTTESSLSDCLHAIARCTQVATRARATTWPCRIRSRTWYPQRGNRCQRRTGVHLFFALCNKIHPLHQIRDIPLLERQGTHDFRGLLPEITSSVTPKVTGPSGLHLSFGIHSFAVIFAPLARQD